MGLGFWEVLFWFYFFLWMFGVFCVLLISTRGCVYELFSVREVVRLEEAARVRRSIRSSAEVSNDYYHQRGGVEAYVCLIESEH